MGELDRASNDVPIRLLRRFLDSTTAVFALLRSLQWGKCCGEEAKGSELFKLPWKLAENFGEGKQKFGKRTEKEIGNSLNNFPETAQNNGLAKHTHTTSSDPLPTAKLQTASSRTNTPRSIFFFQKDDEISVPFKLLRVLASL
nr:putative late blight resistance protein homolog R1A-10 [Ipomoea batatas]